MIVKIKSQSTDCQFEVETRTRLDQFEQACPIFFRNSHGKRETFDMYQGFLIVRHTVTFTGGRPERLTAIYIVYQAIKNGALKLDANCIRTSSNLSVRQAKRLIDKIIKEGSYLFE